MFAFHVCSKNSIPLLKHALMLVQLSHFHNACNNQVWQNIAKNRMETMCVLIVLMFQLHRTNQMLIIAGNLCLTCGWQRTSP